MIPDAALAKAYGRVKVDIIADTPPNHARMGLIKAYHLRKNRAKGGNTMTEEIRPYLNENHPHPAYQCGRLMAVLAKLQKSALGDVGAGVVQRYYAAASSTPALVLGRLVRTSQAHLNKLQPGLAYWYENILAGIWGKIKDAVPATLTLEEQTLFALGYYQQIAQRIAPDKEDQTKEVEND
jgi:CRISPR-associated protein Csd1